MPTPSQTLPLAGLVHQGDGGHSQGGVGWSAHQMTSHPSIDLFIVAPVALFTQGNWAVPFARVSGFAGVWGEGLPWQRRTQGLREQTDSRPLGMAGHD